VLVDSSADINAAAQRIVDSKSFDNSILCTNESVLIVEESVAPALLNAMTRAGAHVLSDDERDRVRDLVFPDGHFDAQWVGKDATAIAAAANVRVNPRTRILIAPVDLVVPEEPLAHEKLCPVLGLVKVANVGRGIDAAQAVLRITGQGHSAAIHSTNPTTIMSFSAAVRVLRVSVNVGNSLGSSGIETNLAPTMTIGTGFLGRSSVGENLEPKHLVNWTRIAYNADASVPMGDFAGLSPWHAPSGSVPAYPRASNESNAAPLVPPSAPVSNGAPDELRDEIRRLIIEELNAIVRG
jgi:acyl-CoA reductase-like NAD-dependent aldehyde dehydrogenase